MKKVIDEERTFVKSGDIEATFYVNEKDFGDSMGFDSGETIATFTDKKNGKKYILLVDGEVQVEYHDMTFRHASDMPEELRKKFLNDWKGIRELEEKGEIYIGANNWFTFFADDEPNEDVVFDIDTTDDYNSVIDTVKDILDNIYSMASHVVKRSERNSYNEQAGLIDFSEESTSKPYVLSHVVPRLIRSDKVSAAKEAGIITEHFMGNLYICWVVIMKEEGEEQVSYSLDEKNLNSIGATLNEIKAAALRNIKGTTEIMPVEDAIGPASDEKSVGATFYVATNEHRHYGATAILLQPEVLNEQERKLGSFNIIPSSVHEVLIVPDTLHISAPELKDMLIDVNTSIVSDKDILDDHVYRYAQGRLTVVD